MNAIMNLKEWLLEEYRKWERKTGRRQSMTAFARFLGVKQPTLNRWMIGDNLPDGNNIRKLAEKLGPEIYDIMGLTRPDDRLREIQNIYNETPAENKDELIRLIKEAAAVFGLKQKK